MNAHKLDLILLRSTFAVCRLDLDSPPPAIPPSGFWSITRTADELSLVCEEDAIPPFGRVERNWRCLRVAGSMDFSMVGVVAALTTPLADAQIGVFVVSTFDTDYLFVKEEDLASAIATLRLAGHTIGEQI